MQILTYIFETELSFSDPVKDHSFVLRCLPKPTSTQKVMESQVFTWPRIPLTEQVDGFGNRLVVGRCPQRHHRFNFYTTGQVMVAHEDAAIRPAHPMYSLPSRLTQPDAALAQFLTTTLEDHLEQEEEAVASAVLAAQGADALTLASAGDGAQTQSSPIDSPKASELLAQAVAAMMEAQPAPSSNVDVWNGPRSTYGGKPIAQDFFSGVSEPLTPERAVAAATRWATARALCHAVYRHFTYEPGATTTATTAAEAFALGAGVCQDYSQVLIVLCRMAGIPARYITGLMMGEGATHAWVEIHDGVRWRALDPTNDRIVDDGYMLFCTGRDFDDCPIERGVFTGNATQTQTVTAKLGVNVLDMGEGARIAPRLTPDGGERGIDVHLNEAIMQQ